MRGLLIVWILLWAQITLASELHCSTNNKIHGWNLQNTYDRLYMYSYVTEDGILVSPYLTGAYYASLPSSERLNPNIPPTRRSYVGFDAYEPFNDSWFLFYPYLPHKFQKRKNRFTAYIQIIDSIGVVETIGLTCRLYPIPERTRLI